MVMRSALNRWHTITEGYKLESMPTKQKEETIRQQPELMQLRDAYREEIYYYQLDMKRRGIPLEGEENG